MTRSSDLRAPLARNRSACGPRARATNTPAPFLARRRPQPPKWDIFAQVGHFGAGGTFPPTPNESTAEKRAFAHLPTTTPDNPPRALGHPFHRLTPGNRRVGRGRGAPCHEKRVFHPLTPGNAGRWRTISAARTASRLRRLPASACRWRAARLPTAGRCPSHLHLSVTAPHVVTAVPMAAEIFRQLAHPTTPYNRNAAAIATPSACVRQPQRRPIRRL